MSLRCSVGVEKQYPSMCGGTAESRRVPIDRGVTVHLSTTAIVTIAAAMIALTITQDVLLCLKELAYERQGRSNLSSSLAVMNWFRNRTLASMSQIGCCAAAIVATAEFGPLAGAAVILAFAVIVVRPRPGTRELVAEQIAAWRAARR